MRRSAKEAGSSDGIHSCAIEVRALHARALGRRPIRVVGVDRLRNWHPFPLPRANSVTRWEMAHGAAHPSGAEHPGQALILRQLQQLTLCAAVAAAKILKHRAAPPWLPRGKGPVKPPAALFRARKRPFVPPHPARHPHVPEQTEAFPSEVIFRFALTAELWVRD